ncbi:wax ester/triacylglycerol synthase family O-acyltransferase [Terrabacter lapilli]|uniref:diacylglycerol O-acyltransferase n=1 Tax=Terrabacter lapilli TaxID=436231 RepID=A0ABN2SDC6_9MICO
MVSVERLSADDRLLLLSDARWPQDVGVVAVVDGGALLDGSGRPRVEAAQKAVWHGLDAVPRLRQVLRVPPSGLGGPYWVDDPSFDLAHHVRVGPELASGDDADLLSAIERIRSRRLDMRRPLWELWLLPGFRDGRLALFVRMHHVMADGVAGVATLATLLSDEAGERPARAGEWSPRPAPSRGELLHDSLRSRGGALHGAIRAAAHPRGSYASAAQLWHGIRGLVTGAPGPVTSLGGLVGPHRRLAVVRAQLEDVEAVAHNAHVTVNDVLLAMSAGGVSALLRSRGESVDGLVVPVLVPVSLRQPDHQAGLGNRISQMAVGLPVGEADPVARLRRISAGTTSGKALPHPSMGAVFSNRVLGALVLRLIIRKRINLLSADIVGPSQPLSFAGATVRDVFPLINLLGNVTLGVGALSYAGRFELLVVADADLHPDVEVLASGAAAELASLVARVIPQRRGRGGQGSGTRRGPALATNFQAAE